MSTTLATFRTRGGNRDPCWGIIVIALLARPLPGGSHTHDPGEGHWGSTWRRSGSRSTPKNLVKKALLRYCALPSSSDSRADTRIMSSSTAPTRAAQSLGTMGARCSAAGSAATCTHAASHQLGQSPLLPVPALHMHFPGVISGSGAIHLLWHDLRESSWQDWRTQAQLQHREVYQGPSQTSMY